MRKWVLISMICLVTSLVSSLSCLKEADLPLLNTTEVGNIKTESAVSGGTIIDDGGARIDVTGICWGTANNPTITNSLSVSRIQGNTKYDCLLFGLTPDTYYHVRAFGKNRVGTSYGNEVHFTTLPIIAKVTTTSVSKILFTIAWVEGKTECDDESIVRERGFCWATKENPTVENTKDSCGIGSGRYNSWIGPMHPGSIYHVRAYAITALGITYGEDISFKTLDTPTITTTVKEFTRTSAKVEGKIISWKNYPSYIKLDEWGFFYGIQPNPVIQGDYYGIWEFYADWGVLPQVVDENGVFTFPFKNLTPGTTYYVTACVLIDNVYYGNEVTFTTNN